MNTKTIEIEIKEIKADIPKLSEFSDDYLFSVVGAKYFFHEGHYSYTLFKDSFVDGKNDGGIDLITVDDSETQPVVICIQGKNHGSLANKQDVVDVFTKMQQTFENFKQGITAQYNTRLRRVLAEKLDQVSDQNPKVRLVLFHGASLEDSRKTEIAIHLENIEALADYECQFFDANDIASQIEAIKNPQTFVHDGYIEFNKEDGKLKYGEDGVLINVYANSLKALYNRYKDSGLFAQNFRYFVRNKKIDDSVIKSLQKKREDFWFLNNGIIIGCKDYLVDGDKIRLEDFSIINGCQTTTLIGEYDGSNQSEDFKLPCKIIKSANKRETFISEIAEASNSQKPILDRDLKSNYPEQTKLLRVLKDHVPPIYLEIKRGQQIPRRKKGQEAWQFVKNDALGQMYLAFIFQQPGTARSNKSKIFSDIDTYNKLFKRTHDADMIADLLKLSDYYKQYQDKQANLGELSANEESVLLNSDKIILALTGFLVKMKRELLDTRMMQDPDEWAKEISRDDIEGAFLNEDAEDFEETLNGLFNQLNIQICYAFDANQDVERSASNFFKTDTKYRDKILRAVYRAIFKDEKQRKAFEANYLIALK